MPTSFAIFFVVWILLGIGSWLFYRTASYETKKFSHPFMVIAFGIIFAGFVEWSSDGKVPLFFLAAIVLITVLNIRNIRFCPRCNATLYNQGFSRPRFCSKCGANLDDDANMLPPNQQY